MLQGEPIRENKPMAQRSKRYGIDPHYCEEGYEKVMFCQHDLIKWNCGNISLVTQESPNVSQESIKSNDIRILKRGFVY